MVRADRILGIILLFLALVCFIEGIRVWDGMGGTGFMPALLGMVFALLGPGLLIPRPPSQASFSIPWPLKAGWQQIGLIFLCMVLYTLLLPLVGFLLGTTLFLTALIWVLGGIRWGIAGVTAVGAFAMPQFLEVNNLPFDSLNKVVFKSGAEVITALAGGHIDFAAQQYSESSALILGKKIRGLALVNPERLPGTPDVPTAKEVGYPGLNVYGWQGVSGPAKLPKEVVEKWDQTLREASKDPAFLEQAAKIYKVIAHLGPKEFWEFMQDEYKRYLPLAIKMGMRK